jgi:MFS family permease
MLKRVFEERKRPLKHGASLTCTWLMLCKCQRKIDSSIDLTKLRIWCIYFVNALQQTTTGSLTPYVTSSFQEHSLTATTSVMSSIIGGLTTLPLSKILDIWGRPQGFLLMVIVLTLGLIMMAACNNVKTYAAAQVFYWVG